MARSQSSTRSSLQVAYDFVRAFGANLRASKAMARPAVLVALLLVLVPVGVMLLKPAPKASPCTITVDTIDDPGNSSECSLHGAIENANSEGTNPSDNNCNAGTGDDIICFDSSIANGTITLDGTLPAIVHTLTIDGTGQNITVSGNSLYQVLVVTRA